jgi:hypothetical protein
MIREDPPGPPKLISAKPTTIAHLVGLTVPKPAPTARSQFERHVYSITAAVTFMPRGQTKTCSRSSKTRPATT